MWRCVRFDTLAAFEIHKKLLYKNSKIFKKEILVYNKMSIDVPFIVLIKVKGSLK